MKLTNRRPAWLNRNLLGFGMASLFSDCSHEMVPLLLPALLGALVSPLSAPLYLGFISGTATAAASLTALFAGWLSDRLVNRKPLVVLGYALSGTLVGGLALVQNWLGVLIVFTLAWIGRGMVSAPRNAVIADSVQPAFYGRAFGFRQAMDTIGSLLGSSLVFIFSSLPIRSLFFIAVIPGILAWLSTMLFVTDVPRKQLTITYKKDITLIPRGFFVFLGALFLFSIANFDKTLLVLRSQGLLSSSYNQVTALSLTTLLYILRHLTQTFSSYAMGALSDKIGRIVPFAFFGLILFGVMCVMLLFPLDHMGYLTIVFFVSGFSAGTYTSLQKSIAADFLPEELRGTGYALLLITNSFGRFLSSIIVGFLWTTVSAQAAFFYAALLSFISAFILVRSRSGKTS